MTPGYHSQSSSEQLDPPLPPEKIFEHLRNQASDSTTASSSGAPPHSLPNPTAADHDPRRNTLGRSPTYASSGSEGSNKFGRGGGKARRGGRAGGGSSSGGSHGGSSSGQHHSGTSRDGSMGDYDPINSPLMPLRV